MERVMESSGSCCSFPGDGAQWPELSKTVGQWDRAEGKSPDEEIAGFPKSSGVVVEGSEEQKKSHLVPFKMITTKQEPI